MSYHIALRRKSPSESASGRAQFHTIQATETINRQVRSFQQNAMHSDDRNREEGSHARQSTLMIPDERPSGHEFEQLRIYADRDLVPNVSPIGRAPLAITSLHIPSTQTAVIARQIVPVQTGSVAPMIQRRPPAGTANTIANGHAYNKHVQQQQEFPEIRSVGDFATLIETIMASPAEHKMLTNGREAFWDGRNTVVIYNPNAADKGTCFRPTAGKHYFDNLV